MFFSLRRILIQGNWNFGSGAVAAQKSVKESIRNIFYIPTVTNYGFILFSDTYFILCSWWSLLSRRDSLRNSSYQFYQGQINLILERIHYLTLFVQESNSDRDNNVCGSDLQMRGSLAFYTTSMLEHLLFRRDIFFIFHITCRSRRQAKYLFLFPEILFQ